MGQVRNRANGDLFSVPKTTMKEAFLIAALALQSFFPRPNHGDAFWMLKEYLERMRPQYTMIYTNDDEELMMLEAEWTPVTLHGLRLWALRKGA